MQVMDFGHAQFTEAKILSEYIKTDAYKMAVGACCPVVGVGPSCSWRPCLPAGRSCLCKPCAPGTTPITTLIHSLQVQARPPMAVTNAVSWRTEGISYKKNEVFLDVVESVNLLVNSNGTVVRSEVVGALKMRAYLSGMPECKLGLNDKVRPGLGRLQCSAGELWRWQQGSGRGCIGWVAGRGAGGSECSAAADVAALGCLCCGRL